MKKVTYTTFAPVTGWFFHHYAVRMISAVIVIIWTGVMSFSPLQAQLNQATQYTQPSWWFGVAGGANVNFYGGTTRQLTDAFTAPVAFGDGRDAGLFLAPLIEYHAPGAGLGFMLQVGYDNRSSSFDQKTVEACNCPADLNADLRYLTIEPSIRLAPFEGNFFFYVGPRLAFNLENSFAYQLGVNPDNPNEEPTPAVNGDFSRGRSALISMQVGAGYDIPFTSSNSATQFVFSPFVAFHPYFGQAPRDIESWSVTTLRVGAAIKFGHGRAIPPPVVLDVIPVEPEFRFSVNSPKNIPSEDMVTETLPLRNYVFFDLGSTSIPDRYVQLNKSQVKDFREDQTDMFKPKRQSGRAERQMVAYYNILNILGDRMVKDPVAKVSLVGSSEKGPEDARAMAESIRQYLVNSFGIDTSRIAIIGRDKPKLPSEQPGATAELELLKEGDRRVSIESLTPTLLMEFHNGPTAPLKPVEIRAMEEAPESSYVSFDVEGANKAFDSWSLEVKDEKGTVQKFGPYTGEKISLPGKTLMGARAKGDYKVTMVGLTKDGKTVRREVPVQMVQWTPSVYKNGMRYSILYEFNESKTIPMYEKYIAEIVTPKIPQGGKVMVRGYTDIIGDEVYNHDLSHARANDVKSIIEASLAKAGRTDVTIEAKGYGEDEKTSLYQNKYPEERFYNRTVVIDILPMK